MKLTQKAQEAFDVIKAHGGECKTSDILEDLGLEKIASVTGRINSLVKKGLVEREDGGLTEDGKKITIVKLTQEGVDFVPSEDDE
jgi:DNA-binding MarR family transcriptional regulator